MNSGNLSFPHDASNDYSVEPAVQYDSDDDSNPPSSPTPQPLLVVEMHQPSNDLQQEDAPKHAAEKEPSHGRRSSSRNKPNIEESPLKQPVICLEKLNSDKIPNLAQKKPENQKKKQNEDSNGNQASKNRYTCFICSQKFAYTSLLFVHYSEKHELTRKSTKKLVQLHKEASAYMDEQEAQPVKAKCNICSKKLDSYDTLKTHCKKKHSKGRMITCGECEKPIKAMHHFVEHLEIHENKRKYLCPVCDTTFNSYPSLYSHNKFKRDHKQQSSGHITPCTYIVRTNLRHLINGGGGVKDSKSCNWGPSSTRSVLGAATSCNQPLINCM